MNIKLLFPIVLIVLSVCAAGVYLWYGDIKHAVYWLAAAVLQTSVTV